MFSYLCFFSLAYVLCVQILQRILMGTDVVKNVNKNNASHAVLFEALALVSFNSYVLVPCFVTMGHLFVIPVT